MGFSSRVVVGFVVISLAGFARAEAPPYGEGASLPPDRPAFTLLTPVVPANGSLIFQLTSGSSTPSVVVRDATGVVAGSTTEYGAHLIFVPSVPWVPGASYSVDIPNTYSGSAVSTAVVTVLAADLTPVPALEPALSFRIDVSDRYLNCFAEAARVTLSARTLESSMHAVKLDVTPEPLPVDSALTGQLLAGVTLSDGPLVPELRPWQPVHTFTRAAASAARVCAQLHVLDVRSRTTSVGPSVCASTELVPTSEAHDITSALAEDACTVPDFQHVTAWCALNAAGCADGGCEHFASVCPVATKDAGVTHDAATLRADASADAGDAGAPGVIVWAEDSGGGGCSVNAHGTRPSGALVAWMAALVLTLRRRRARSPRPPR